MEGALQPLRGPARKAVVYMPSNRKRAVDHGCFRYQFLQCTSHLLHKAQFRRCEASEDRPLGDVQRSGILRAAIDRVRNVHVNRCSAKQAAGREIFGLPRSNRMVSDSPPGVEFLGEIGAFAGGRFTGTDRQHGDGVPGLHLPVDQAAA